MNRFAVRKEGNATEGPREGETLLQKGRAMTPRARYRHYPRWRKRPNDTAYNNFSLAGELFGHVFKKKEKGFRRIPAASLNT